MDKDLNEQNEIKNLLKEAHDKMDDANTEIEYKDYVCMWCYSESWNGAGIIHQRDCILIRMRAIKGIG